MRSLVAVVLVLVGLLGWRVDGSSAMPPPLVEVTGEVARPGLHAARTVGEALTLAGVPSTSVEPLPADGRIHWEDGWVSTPPSTTPLVLGRRIDLNTAPVALLERLPGVGPVTAARVVEARPFGSVEDLLRVKGIGPRSLERLRPVVEVR